MDTAKDDWSDRWVAGARTFYLAEITRQSSYALCALTEAVRQGRHRPIKTSPWPQVQAFLAATANVSKLLWPYTRQRTGESIRDVRWRTFRGQRLREELAVMDTSALKGRKVRNAAEHFDERMDGPLRDQQLSTSWSDLEEDSFQRLPFPFRAIDVEQSEVIAGDHRLPYLSVADELAALVRRCEAIAPEVAGDPDTVSMIAMLRWPPLPSILAASERPGEPITTGVDLDRDVPQTLEDVLATVRKLIDSPSP